MEKKNIIPLVSVIIPLYNSEAYISETLDSVLNQTWENVETIIVDDSSTDESFNIANKYKNQFPEKIKVYTNPGKGACAARNYGFKQSLGEYIQYLDADDILSSNKIEKQVLVLHNETDKIAVCETWHFFNTIDKATNTDKPYLIAVNQPEDFFIQLWGGKTLPPNMVQTSAWLTPRSLIKQNGGWNENLHKDQDGEFFARIALNSKGIIYVPDIKNYYRQHISSKNIAGQKQRKHLESNLEAAQLKEKYLFERNQSEDAKLAMATQYKHVAIEAWPNYKDVTIEAMSKCKKLGGSNYLPVMGGRVIELLKQIFGWRIAKSVSYYLHKLI